MARTTSAPQTRPTSTPATPPRRARVLKSEYLPMRITAGELAALQAIADDPTRWPERRSIAVSEAARRLILAGLDAAGVRVVEPTG